MIKKSTIKSIRSAPVNNSRSHTQQLKSYNSPKQWVDILQGIDVIANKLKQITTKQQNSRNKLSKAKSNNKLIRQQRICCSSIHNASTACDSSSMKSKRKETKRSAQSSRNKYKGCKTKSNTQYTNKNYNEKWAKRISTCSNTCNNSLKKITETSDHPQTKRQDVCSSKCHQVMDQMLQLKKLNQNLMKKNQQLQKRLEIQNQQKINLKNKFKRYKDNEIVLKIINQNREQICHKNRQSQLPQSFCIEIKPSPSQIKQTNSNQLAKLSPIPRKNNEQQQYKSRILDLSKAHIKNEQLLQMKPTIKHKNKKGNQLQSLETQFDRLMQMSHMQKNKTRKRLIRDQMKIIANQLKMMRYFTQI